MRGITLWREPSGSVRSTLATTRRYASPLGKTSKNASYLACAESTRQPSKSNTTALNRMLRLKIRPPVGHQCFTLLAWYSGDRRILVVGIVVIVRCRNLFNNRAPKSMELMPAARLHQKSIPRRHLGLHSVFDNFQIPVEKLKCLLLLLMEVIRMLLPRQLYDQLLSIAAVHAGDNDRTKLAETAQPIVM